MGHSLYCNLSSATHFEKRGSFALCGILAMRPAISDTEFEVGLASLAHRGPDGSSSYIDCDISLGMTRLAIIGRDSIDQPSTDCTESLRVIFNGEIYNFIELQEMLIKRGHEIPSDSSDAAIIPHLYEDFGVNFIHRIRGMFAIILWDSKSKNLHFFRDSTGIKPLYFTVNSNQILVASEINTLLKMAPAPVELSNSSIKQFVEEQMVSSPNTIWEGIYSVPPGTVITNSPSNPIRIERWNHSHFPSRRKNVGVFDEIIQLDKLLRESVNEQFHHGAKPAILLSGGLDSSLIARYVAESGNSTESFHLHFECSSSAKEEDRSNAQRVAREHGFTHTEITLNSESYFAQLNTCLDSFRQPFAGVTSMYFISKEISKRYRSCLTGDGADELFCSYKTVRHFANVFFSNKESEENKTWSNNSSLDEFMNQELSIKPSLDPTKGVLLNFSSNDPSLALVRSNFEGSIMFDQLKLLPDQVLLYSDHLSMRHGLEIRPPFLDENVVCFARSLPKELLINKFGETKLILRILAERYFQKDFIYRRKEGFAIPLESWLNDNHGKNWLYQNLKDFGDKTYEYLDKRKVRKLVEGYVAGSHRDFFLVYRIIVLGRFLSRSQQT